MPRAARTRPTVPGPDWLGPYRWERERGGTVSGPQWTRVGSVGDRHRALVDPRGLVTPWPGGWSLDWWVGASDRWHIPGREAATRQGLVDNTPVVETVMRVPRGDVAFRVYGVPGPPALVVAEAENRSDVPVAIAFALRPYNPSGAAPLRRIEAEGITVTVEGRPALYLPRAPSAVSVSTAAGGDCLPLVTGSDATGGWPMAPVVDREGLAHAAFVYALPHTKTLRVAMPLAPGPTRRRLWPGRRPAPLGPVDPGLLPAAADVVRGWQAHLRRRMRLVVPDAALSAAVEANQAYALLLGDGGEHGAAAGGAAPFDAIATWRRVRDLLATAGPTYTWAHGDDGHAAEVGTEFLAAVRNLMVREDHGPGARLALCSLYPPEWAGLPVEVHDAPTAHGRVSYALRWHGDRPALLWECEQPGVHLSAPGLDQSWASGERTGEALLGPFRGRVTIPLAEPD